MKHYSFQFGRKTLQKSVFYLIFLLQSKVCSSLFKKNHIKSLNLMFLIKPVYGIGLLKTLLFYKLLLFSHHKFITTDARIIKNLSP